MTPQGTRFDAYSATTRAATHEQAFGFLYKLGDDVYQSKGMHGFAERVAAKDSTGSEVGYVMWGGSHGDRIMIEVKGERTPATVERIRQLEEHSVTRVDSCADFEAPDEFMRLYGIMKAVKEERQIYAQHLGDWEMPELGRTYWMGAKSSPVRCRLYEKGKQPEYRHLGRPDWARAEIQVRPQKEAKKGFASLTSDQVWGAARWTRDIAGHILAGHVNPHPAGTVYRLDSDEKALRWMCRQYGPRMLAAAEELGGWDLLGLTLREMCKEEERAKRLGC